MRGRPSAAPASPALSWWATPRGAGVIVALVAVAAFARALGNGFTYDEGLVLVGAQRFLQSGAFGALFGKRYFAASLEGTWRPFCTLTYMLDAMVWFHPAMFKADSLLWHIAAALLLMAFTRRLLPEARRPLGHRGGPAVRAPPHHGRDGRQRLVPRGLAGHRLHAGDADPGARPAAGAGARRVRAGPSVEGVGGDGAGAAGVAAARPVRRPIPRAFGAPEPAAPRGLAARLGRAIVELIPYGVVTVIYLAIRFGPLKTPVAYARYPGGTFGDTLIGLPAIWAHDLRLLVWPWPLCADYTGYFRFGPQPWGPVLLASAIVAGYLGLGALVFRRGERVAALGLGWFLLALLPVSNLLPMPIPAAERFLYLPLCGIAIAAAVARRPLRRAASRPRGAPAGGGGAGAALAALAVVLNLRHGDWRDDQPLWQATVAVNPRSCGAQSAVGREPALTRDAERRPGDPARLGRPRGAGAQPLQRRQRSVSGRLHLYPAGGGARAARRSGRGARGAGAGGRPPPALRAAVRLARLPGVSGRGPHRVGDDAQEGDHRSGAARRDCGRRCADLRGQNLTGGRGSRPSPRTSGAVAALLTGSLVSLSFAAA